MFTLTTHPYKDETGSGFAVDIVDDTDGRSWRVTGATEKAAISAAKDVVTENEDTKVQSVSLGSEVTVPA
jgi:hypothetical protein